MVDFHAISGDVDHRHVATHAGLELAVVSALAGNRPTASFRRALLCLATILVLAVPALVQAQVAIDTAGPPSSAELARGGSLTFAHTTAGTNRVLVVGVSMNISQKNTTTVSGVTYNGVALTPAGAQNNPGNTSRTEMWYLRAPVTGSNNVVVSLNVPAGGNPTIGTVAGAITFTGADQTTPIRSFVSNTGNSAFAFVNSTSAINDYVFENLALVSGTTAASASTAQTQQWSTTSTGGNRDAYGSGSTRAGAPSVPMNETLSASVNWADAAVSIQPSQADLSVTASGSSALFPSNLAYTVNITNNGPSAASTISLTDTLASGVTLVSAVASGGTGGSCTGTNCSWTSLAVGATATATITVLPSAPGGYPLTSSVSATTPDLLTANNSTTSVSYSEIDQCTSNTVTNNTTITGTINEYFPGAATANAGSTTITLGTATGTAHTLGLGDEVLVIQMQDAAIAANNNSTYGDGVSGSGSTNLHNAGVYEYATVVSFAAPTLTIRAAGPGGGLLYTYTATAASATQGARRFQVIYVPKFNNGTLSGNLTASAWNGSSGGVIALDIAGVLTLGGRSISVDGMGFRGAAALFQNGAATAANTNYLFTAPTAYTTTGATPTVVGGADGSKAEGIAGTPAWIENSTATAGVVTAGTVACTTGTSASCNEPGYPSGSMARGAPGNAGGGATDGHPTANDQNAGGGGGANGGSGGQGGNSWNSNLSVGGLGGATFPAGISRVVMGGGGGAGSSNNNNSFVSSSGAPGGGIVMIRANQITGNVTITANGWSAYDNTPQDGGGGGGAAGSIVFLWNSVSAGTSAITLTANGGAGGDAWDADAGGNGCGAGCGGGGLFADRHGPGGGGGGGIILYSGSANANVTPTANGGAAGVTLATANLFYGATGGGAGTSTSGATINASPGPHTATTCTDVSVTKSASPNPVIVNNPLTFTITVANTTANASPVTMTDTLPSDITYISSSFVCTPSTFGCSSGLCIEDPSTGVLQCSWPTISAGQTATVTVNTTAATPYTLATNTAIVNSSTADSNPLNNTSTVSVPIEGPTAVRLNSFQAARSNNGVLLSWTSGGELRNLGFNVYREVGGKKVLLNPSLIAGSALLMREALAQHGAKSYGWIDSSATAGALYWLEDVDLNGARTLHGPVSAQNLTSLQGTTAQAKSFAQPQAAVRAMTMQDMAAATQEQTPAFTPHFREAVVHPAVLAKANETGFLLAAQPAVKILADHEGWYRIAQSQLVAAGLPANLPASSLHLYAEGVEQPVRITNASGTFGPQAALEFYGTAIDTPFSGQRVYWLAWSPTPGMRISNFAEAGSAGPEQPSFVQTLELKPRTTYFAALLREDTDNFFGPLVSPTPAVLNLDAANSLPGQGTMEVSLQGVTNNQQHTVTVSLNGAALGELSFTGQQLVSASFEIPSGVLINGTNSISLTSQMGASDVSLVDHIDVSFPHSFTAESDFLKFTAQSGQRVAVDGFAGRPERLVDITDPVHPLLLHFDTKLAGTYSLTSTVPWTSSGEHTLIALSSQSMAIAANILPHAPSNLHASQPGANVVMLTAPQFDAQMQPLAVMHRSQGASVALLNVGQVYDEFNFGEPSPYAIKGFLQNAEKVWHNKPRYLLLGGDASVDPRDYLGFGFFDFVPTKIIATSELKTASDDWFSDFDNTGFATIATGRLPGRITADMQTMVSKTLNYFSTPGASWANNAMMVADVGDPSISFSQESAALQKLLPSSLNVSDLFVDAVGAPTVRQGILSGIQSGQLLVDYNGHGSVEIWGGSDLFDDTAASTLTNGNRLPLFVMMNCLNGFFHDVFTQSLASSLLLSPNGGAVAVWASSGLSAPDPQFQMNQALVKNLFAGQPVALGDAVLAAKQGIADPDARRTFILFGDPLLQIKRPAGGISQFSIAKRPVE